MAKSGTRKSPRATHRSRRWPYVLLAGFAVLALAWWYYGATARGYARVGTAYGARVACSCRYVAGRSLADCKKDKLAGMELITLSDDDETKSVTARFPLLASDTATWRKGYGCVLQPWED
ncbi:MAG: hypothetical protein IE933_09965 [Sphingomonadales bacterium]|nr:hypothetical protein [Sphingomonadales bacterium]MBD3774040.1 hypothetical protein [Paracoccaceae bacterium]